MFGNEKCELVQNFSATMVTSRSLREGTRQYCRGLRSNVEVQSKRWYQYVRQIVSSRSDLGFKTSIGCVIIYGRRGQRNNFVTVT